MKRLKNKSGITLIALVITIIVLLILAGVAINLAIGERGIFNQSKLAVEKYKDAQNKEEEQLQIAANAMLGNISGNRDENEYVLKSQYDTLLSRVEALEKNPNSQSGSSSISNNYSTDEQVVGKWIDGKPLYQKTILFGDQSGANEWTEKSLSSFGINDVDKAWVIQSYGYYKASGTGKEFESFPIAREGASSVFIYEKNVVFDSENRSYISYDIVVTIQYTKTTDGTTN